MTVCADRGGRNGTTTCAMGVETILCKRRWSAEARLGIAKFFIPWHFLTVLVLASPELLDCLFIRAINDSLVLYICVLVHLLLCVGQ